MTDATQAELYATPEGLDPVDAPGARVQRGVADKDETVTDAEGVERKLFKGQPIPGDIATHLAVQEAEKSDKSDSKSAKK